MSSQADPKVVICRAGQGQRERRLSKRRPRITPVKSQRRKKEDVLDVVIGLSRPTDYEPTPGLSL